MVNDYFKWTVQPEDNNGDDYGNCYSTYFSKGDALAQLNNLFTFNYKTIKIIRSCYNDILNVKVYKNPNFDETKEYGCELNLRGE